MSGDFERFCGDLDEIESEPERPCFSHSFTRAPMEEVVGALGTILPADWPPVESVFTGLIREHCDRQLFLACASEGVILWHSVKTLPAVVSLSQQLSAGVHWMAVNEEFTLRAYGNLQRGVWQRLITDPPRYWSKNLLSGDDLIGKGDRHFTDLGAFLTEIEPHFTPVDTLWDFETWMDTDRRQRILGSPECRFRRCIRLSCVETERHVEAIGDWRDSDVTQVRKWFGECR